MRASGIKSREEWYAHGHNRTNGCRAVGPEVRQIAAKIQHMNSKK